MKPHVHTLIGAAAGAAIASLVTLAAVPREMQTEAPGVERWAAKTGGLPGDDRISLTPTPTTIHALVSLPRPDAADGEARVAPVERTCYRLTGTLTAYKEEADGDEHLCLEDGGESLISEIPRPDFLPASCPWKRQITTARSDFMRRFHPTNRFQTISVRATITGIGFFDHPHNQRGVAPNAVELHPVIGLEVMQ